ncbi:MAG: hypothetical protein AAGA28_09905 [Pseudomonadota bacterium]
MSDDLNDIAELQSRINGALDRLGQAMEAQTESAADTAGLATLQQALDDEKVANEQLEERLKSARATRSALEEEVANLRDQNAQAMARLDTELQSLRRANRQLRDNNAALRGANSAGVGEPHLINKSMMAELEALRAERSADRAEADAILSALGAALDNAARNGGAAQEDA